MFLPLSACWFACKIKQKKKKNPGWGVENPFKPI